MSPNVFNESIQSKGPYSKPEVQKLQQQLEKMPLEEIRKQLDELSTEVETKLKYANMGSLDAKYKKFLNVRENLTLIDGLYDKLFDEQKKQVDNYQQGGSEWSVAVMQSALLQLGLLPQDTVLGIFDKNTLYAVISFQKMSKDYTGKQDGLIGKQTLTALQLALDSDQNFVTELNALKTKPELEQIQDNIQDLQKQVELVTQTPVSTNGAEPSAPFAQVNESVVLTQQDIPSDNTTTSEVTPTPTIEDAQDYIDALIQLVQDPRYDKASGVQITEKGSVPIEDIVPDEDAPLDQINTQDNTEVIPSPEKSVKTEQWHPIYNTLDDYIVSYMDSKGYDLGQTPEELQKQIQKYTKEALVANPSILRYGMVLRAQDTQGNYYIGTLVEEPSKKDFTKSNVLRVNRPGKNNTIENIAFPLENIVAVLPNEKQIFTPDQQKEFDKLQAKYKKQQEKIQRKESKKETTDQ